MRDLTLVSDRIPPGDNKYRVTAKIFGNVVPADFRFVSMEIVVWADSPESAEEYAEAFLGTYGISLYVDIDEVAQLTLSAEEVKSE